MRAMISCGVLAALLLLAAPSPASATFVDVLPDHPFFTFVYALSVAGITGGCSSAPPLYCVGSSVTRAQMAIFLLRGIHGAAYQPPPATGDFADVPLEDNFAAPFIEQLLEEGVTGGCATDPLRYCPKLAVTRAQMAIFLVRAFGLPTFPSWLAQVNIWRARAGLPGVVENATWSQGDLS